METVRNTYLTPIATALAALRTMGTAGTLRVMAQSAVHANRHVSEQPVDASIPEDSVLKTMLEPYEKKVLALNTVIGKLSGDLKKSGIGAGSTGDAGSIGNFVADGMRARSSKILGVPIKIAITNNGGLRKSVLSAGDLRVSEIYELLPFENALVQVDLSGADLRRLLAVIVSQRDAQSGAHITYKTEESKLRLVDVRLDDQKNDQTNERQEIDLSSIYTIVTTDYMVDRGGDYSVLKEAKKITPLNITLRDCIIDYVKDETAAGRPIKVVLDDRFRDTTATKTTSVSTPRSLF